jgi:hypothetical protein
MHGCTTPRINSKMTHARDKGIRHEWIHPSIVNEWNGKGKKKHISVQC